MATSGHGYLWYERRQKLKYQSRLNVESLFQMLRSIENDEARNWYEFTEELLRRLFTTTNCVTNSQANPAMVVDTFLLERISRNCHPYTRSTGTNPRSCNNTSEKLYLEVVILHERAKRRSHNNREAGGRKRC